LVVLLSAVAAAPRFLPSEDRQTTLGPSPVVELAPAAQPKTEEMRSAGIASQTPAILASETPSSTFAAATEATAKVPATSEQEPVSEMPRTIRLLAWVGIVVLAFLTLAGFWFGFLLPARRVRRFPVVRR
jgi:cobalamin biosynthesis Mg chelatase CobN